jgi:GNAT superfamily N-acetyltransferase
MTTTTVRRVTDPADAATGALSRLLYVTFADPDVVLDLERMQAFLAEDPLLTGREFNVLVAEEGGTLLGASIFSYVPASNCGFSEYLVVRKDRHGHGVGRQLVDARRAHLGARARDSGHAASSGLFIEADNPERTPAALQARERETAMDTLARLRLFDHLGFLRVDLAYVQPRLGPYKEPVTYLDLLFAPWDEQVAAAGRLPADWVYATLGPIWDSWAADHGEPHAAGLRQRLGQAPLALRPLF